MKISHMMTRAILVVSFVALAGCSDLYSRPLSKNQKDVFDFCAEKKSTAILSYNERSVIITCTVKNEGVE